MDFYLSNAKPIAAIGIVLVVMMAYCFAFLRRKVDKRSKYAVIVSNFKGLMRYAMAKTGIFRQRHQVEIASKASHASDRPSERFGNLNDGDPPDRDHDAPRRQWAENPESNKKNGEKSVSSKANSPFAHTNLGNLEFKRRNYGRAAWHYKQALQINRRFDAAHVGLGNIAYQQGKVFLAMKFYTVAIQMNTKNPDALVRLGNCFQLIRKYEKALECYEKAYALDNRNKVLNAELANLYIAKNEYEKAHEILTRSIALYPCSGRFYKSVGDMYTILKRESKAVDAYVHFINLRCDKSKLTNLVRSKFDRYLGLEIISNLIKKERKINYDSFVKEMTRMMTIFLVRQRLLGEPNNAKHKAYQNFSSYFINKVLVSIAQKKNPPMPDTVGCDMPSERESDPNSIIIETTASLWDS